jgi:hypothetical protein
MGTAKVQINPPGLATTDNGYISSITVRYNGADNVLTPDTSAYPANQTYGQISINTALAGANDAVSRLVGGAGGNVGPGGGLFKLIFNPGN